MKTNSLFLIAVALSEEVIDEDADDSFDHLKDIVTPEELETLNSLTHADKIFLMEKLLAKMDVDQDNFLELNEIHTWIHYVEQTRVIRDVNKHVSQNLQTDKYSNMQF